MKAGRDPEALIAKPPPDARLFLFCGPDAGQSRELAGRLAQRLGGERVELAAAVLKDDPARLADEAAAVSMFGDAALLFVGDAGEATTEAARLLLDAGVAGNPAVLVAGDLKATSGLRKLCEGHAFAQAFVAYPPDARQFAVMARTMARARGLDPTAEAAGLAAAAAAGERGVLGQELDKLAAYLDAAPERVVRLEAEHVRAVGAGEGAGDIAPLIDAVASRDPAAAARALARLASERVAGIALLRAAERRLAQLGEARAGVEAGAGAEAAVKALRPPVFWKEQAGVIAQVGAWRGGEIAAARGRLLAAERAIKSGGSAGDLIAEQALLAASYPA